MKKILTLLLAAGAFAVTAQAQTSRDEARRVILGDGNKGSNNGGYGNGRDVILGGGSDNNRSYPGNYPSGSDRQYQVDQINRDYDAKIQSIRNNPYLSAQEKDRAIRQLERDRQRRIEEVSRNYNNGYGDDRYEGRHDNGKHKGWYKKDKNKNWKKGQNRDWDRD